uniref:Major capsid protein n=1 Tax=Dulem virus 96 TaxID=3145807 RepID=A0AAU8AUF4_9VIRU
MKRIKTSWLTRLVNPGRSVFGLSKVARGTCKMGYMIPVFCRDLLPGDRVSLQIKDLIRFMPMIAPPMHQVKAYFDWFFVPNRLVWSNWENFRTGGEDGKDASVVPYVTSGSSGWSTSSLFDYLCCPTGVANLKMSALPLRCHNLIYNFYVRDENVRDELPVPKTDGLDTTAYALYRRNWPRDYFTAALPSSQRGDMTYLPLATEAPIVPTADGTSFGVLRETSNQAGYFPIVASEFQSTSGGLNSSGRPVRSYYDPQGSLKADLTRSSAASVDGVRTAFQVQLIKQLMMRAGYRYREFMYAFFGEDGGDARLQWPEYIGSSVSDVLFSEVLQTSESATTPQANMAGHGISADTSRSLHYKSREDGWLFCYMTIMPKASYQQGLPRQFQRYSRYDYYNPLLAHLGEDMILNSEIYAQGTDADSQGWAYQAVYEDYRRSFDSSHGEIRTTAAQWAFDRKFSALPQFNGEFQECVPSTAPFADQNANSDQIVYMVQSVVNALRPIPRIGEPGYMDHYF